MDMCLVMMRYLRNIRQATDTQKSQNKFIVWLEKSTEDFGRKVHRYRLKILLTVRRKF